MTKKLDMKYPRSHLDPDPKHMKRIGNIGTETRTPPHSVEAEQAVLGGLLLDNAAWQRLDGLLAAGDFYRHDHKLIFEAITNLAERGEAFDIVTVAERLNDAGSSVEAGGMAYLGELVGLTPSAANIEAHARIVGDRALRRRLLALTVEVLDTAHDPGGKTTGEVLAEAEARLLTLQGAMGQQGVVVMRDVLAETVAAIEQRYESKSPIIGLPTGFQDLDELTAGMIAPDLIILAARPSMGKTALASCIAEHVAVKGTPVLFASMEMSTQPLGLRMLSSMGRIDQQKLRTGRLDESDWPRLTNAVSMLHQAPLTFDTRARSVAEVRASARRIPGLGLLVIDYLGLMSGDGENQTQRIGAITAGVKNIARDLNIPVILLAQLNRELEKRPNKRPILSDLRDSGEIEQHADLVWFIYRDEVYNKDSAAKGVAELIVAKQRNGRTDTVRLTFQGQYLRFENYHPDVYGVQL